MDRGWWGGEFVAVVPHCDANRAQQLMQRIQSRIVSWTRSSGLPMAVSLGVSHAPHDGNVLITLFAVARYQFVSEQGDATRVLHAQPQLLKVCNES